MDGQTARYFSCERRGVYARQIRMRFLGSSNRNIPHSIWALGFVSMFMDISSEMIHSLLPVFVVSILGISATALGLIEGVAEGAVNIVKIFSGALRSEERRVGKECRSRW